MPPVDTAAKLLSRALQKRIMHPVDPDHPPRRFKEGKFMVFIGGGNGSGKTVVNNLLFDQMDKEGYHKEYVAKFGSNIFEDILATPPLKYIRVRLEQYLHNAASSHKAGDAERPPGFFKKVALQAFKTIRSKAMEAGAPIIVDYHMHDKAFVEDCVREAKENGYECIMITPHLDAENIIPRLESRQKRTGRPFKLDKIIDRHRKFAENLDGYLDMFDLSIILDNNKENTPPSIIAISHNGNTTVYNEEAYDKVRKKTRLNSAATSADDLWEQGPGEYTETGAKPDPGTMGQGDQANHGTGKKNAGDGHFVRMIETAVQNALRLK